jgi:choline dehydrogenase-like flavoprotein
MKNKYKIIIVGSGPGACVPGYMFAEKGLDVLMIEKGINSNIHDTDSFSCDEINNKYKNAGMTVAYGKTLINYAEGSCVGGGSEVNSGLYHRIPTSTLKSWEEKNKFTFDKSFLDKSYKVIEKLINVSLMPESHDQRASLKLKEGCDNLNWECSEVPRWFKYDSKGVGVKQSMTETLIPKFLNSGGTLIDKCEVIKISSSNKINNVHVKCNDGIIKIFSSDFIFLCTGAINSPHLLIRSGFKRRIGKTLKLHPTFKFISLFNDKINSKNMGVHVHQVKEFSPKISMGCSISSKGMLSVGLNDCDNLNYISHWEKMSTYYSMISPEGVGSVNNIPFFKSPFVRFSLTDGDYENIYLGMEKLAEILFSAGAKLLFPSVSSSLVIKSMNDLKKIRVLDKSKLNLMTIHLFSTIPIGGLRNEFPLSPDGYLYDNDSIYISDGSMLCDSPSVNPQGAIMAIARMNAIKFLERIKNEI